MKQVTVKYRPISFIPWYRTARGSHPSNWQEISSNQFLAISSMLKKNNKEIDFLSAMTGIKKRILKKLDEYQKFKISELIDFTRQRNPVNSFIIPELNITGMHLMAPQTKLKAMPFGQFIFVDTLFGNYQENPTEENLCKFLAALFIPKGTSFKEDIIERNGQLFQKTKSSLREAIVINYLLIKEWLIKTYPLLFIINEDGTATGKNKDKQTRDPMAWIKTFENLVGNDIANEDKYAALPVHTVLRFITRKVKENMKQKNK